MTCLLLLVLILALGVVGYRFIEGWRWIDSLYMTVITISTVGFKEIRELSDPGRIHTIVLIFAGVGTLAVTLSVTLEKLFQHQFKLIMEKRGMQSRINSLKEHTIVCGYGRMGRIIAETLHRLGEPLVVVDNDANRVADAEKSGGLVIKGDANDEVTLQQAGIARAKALVATLGTDADNLFLTLTARGINAKLDIIARAENENNGPKFTQAGASRVVSPFAIGAGHIVRVLTRPTVVDFVDLITAEEDIKLEVIQTTIDKGSPFAGRTLAESRIRQEMGGMVIAIRKQNKTLLFDPSPSTQIDVDDRLYVLSSSNPDQVPL